MARRFRMRRRSFRGALLHDDDGSQHHPAVREDIANRILQNADQYSGFLDDDDFNDARLPRVTEDETLTWDQSLAAAEDPVLAAALREMYAVQRLERYVRDGIRPAGSYLTELSIRAFRELHPDIHICILTYLNSALEYSGQYNVLPPDRADGTRGRILLHSGGHYEVLEPIVPVPL